MFFQTVLVVTVVIASCAASEIKWTRTSPTVAASLDNILQHKDTLLVCGRELQVTNPTLSSWHTVPGTFNCYSMVSGPAGFLAQGTDNVKFIASANGRTWRDLNLDIAGNSFTTYGEASRYYICGENYTSSHWEYQCAISEDLKHWTHTPLLVGDSPYEYYHLSVNDTAVIAQADYTPDNRTWHSVLMKLDIAANKWELVYSRTVPARRQSPTPQIIMGGVDGGWLFHNFTATADVVLLWSDDFLHFKSGLIETSTSKAVGGTWNGCKIGSTVALFGIDWPKVVALSSTPFDPKSWKLKRLPEYGDTNNQWTFRCLNNQPVISNSQGGLQRSPVNPTAPWQYIYNGVIGSATSVVTDGNIIYVPTSGGDGTWRSTNNGALWRPLAVPQPSNFVYKYAVGKDVLFVGTNRTHVYMTHNWESIGVAPLPGDIQPYHGGAQQLTVFNNMIVVASTELTADTYTNFIYTTPFPLQPTAKFTVRYKNSVKRFGPTISKIAGDDASGAVWAAGNNKMLLYSTDGVHWKSVEALKDYDETEGIASGGGQVFAIIRKEDKNFTSHYAVYNLGNSGAVQQTYAFSTEERPYHLQYESHLKAFIFAWSNGDIGFSTNNFKSVNRTVIANHPEFETATIATTSTHIVAAYCGGANQQSFIYTTPMN